MHTDTTRIAPAQLSQLVGSRLCHDLVSPLGAIGNGVELLEMAPDFPGLAASPELQLIAESVAAARARIQLFRMAFGLSQSDHRISRGELVRLSQSLSPQNRLVVEIDAQGDFARAEVRMVMLALMCMETAMPWGGRAMVLYGSAGWRLVAQADRTRPDPDLWAWLDSTGGRPLTPAEVQFALLGQAAQNRIRPLKWDLDDKGAEIAF